MNRITTLIILLFLALNVQNLYAQAEVEKEHLHQLALYGDGLALSSGARLIKVDENGVQADFYSFSSAAGLNFDTNYNRIVEVGGHGGRDDYKTLLVLTVSPGNESVRLRFKAGNPDEDGTMAELRVRPASDMEGIAMLANNLYMMGEPFPMYAVGEDVILDLSKYIPEGGGTVRLVFFSQKDRADWTGRRFLYLEPYDDGRIILTN